MQNDSVFTRLSELRNEGKAAIENALSSDSLSELHKKYLGKKGELQAMMKSMKDLSPEERPRFGALINDVKDFLEDTVAHVKSRIEARAFEAKLASESADLTLPGRKNTVCSEHPLRKVQNEIENIFLQMGFEIALGPQSEWDYFNFEALNFPADHPARDMQDTLMLENGSLLRTHTSPVQIRTMLCYEPPIRIIAPGAVYRRDDDITHSPLFHQVEGLQIEENITLAHLKGVLQIFASKMFGSGTKVRLRPSFFPFTEPSVEVDIGCIFCHQDGCRVCKNTGWIEILGSGLVDPNVLNECGIDSEKWNGWAFGVGVERVAMLLYGISDIRYFFESDMRFLSQFS